MLVAVLFAEWNSEPESKFGFQTDFALKEGIDWLNRRQQFQQELEERRKIGEKSLVLRGTEVLHKNRLWKASIHVGPSPN